MISNIKNLFFCTPVENLENALFRSVADCSPVYAIQQKIKCSRFIESTKKSLEKLRITPILSIFNIETKETIHTINTLIYSAIHIQMRASETAEKPRCIEFSNRRFSTKNESEY